MCDCISYNRPEAHQTTPQVKLVRLNPTQHRDQVETVKYVSVDACIARQVEALWNAGVETLSCCCGHGRRDPSVIVDSPTAAAKAVRVLSQCDERRWTVYAWVRAEVGVANPGGRRVDDPPEDVIEDMKLFDPLVGAEI